VNPLARFLAFLAPGRPAPEAPPATQQPGVPVYTVGEAPGAPLLPSGPRGTVGIESRAWRNCNPGNLRPPRTWKAEGMIGIDERPGGPFCIFATEAHGWQALATRVLQLHKGGTRTVRSIIGIWAPPVENRTDVYVAGVAAKLGVSPDRAIDVTDYAVMDALADAIRRHEGLGSDPAWAQSEQDKGFAAAGVVKP
jgi:hypothetical protein